MEEKSLVPDSYYEHRRRSVRWRAGNLPAAGIYLLDGEYHVAIHGSAEERRLQRDGALAVASVTFDGAGREAQQEAQLFAEDSQRQIPVIHPVMDHDYTFNKPVFGGELSLHSNLTSLSRENAFFDRSWVWRM